MNQEIWHPDDCDKGVMRLLLSIGKTYNDYYLFKYGRHLGTMFERLSISLLKLDHNYELNNFDRSNYLELKDRLKNRMQEVLVPRFTPGDLAGVSGVDGICTVIDVPVVDEKRGKIVVNVMMDGRIFSVESRRLRNVKNHSRQSHLS